MLSFFRPSRIYFNQITNTRRKLCGFTSIFLTQSNVNHEVTRKLSTSKLFSIEIYSAHSKEKLFSAANCRHWTSQLYRLQNFSSSRSGPGTFDDARTLMIAGLSSDTTVAALRECFSKKWEVINCVIPRNKQTGNSLGYGFVELLTAEQAKHALEFDHYIDGKEVRVMMKGYKELNDKYRIFVGGLLKETSGETLHCHFSQFGDIFECHIVRNDDNSSKGFGYVTYKSQDSVDRALNSQPHFIDNKVVTVKHTPYRRELTLFIGNLSPKTTDGSLREHFSKYGQLTQCNVKTERQTGQSRGFGYVAFSSQEELNHALQEQPHVVDGVKVNLDYETSDFDLVVDSLPPNISEELWEKSLWDYFSRYGRVRQCTFIKNSAGNTTAFVALSSIDEISRALNARPHRIDGQLVDTHQKGVQFKLYVGNLPKGATDEDLYEIFSKVGKPVHWNVMRAWKDKTNRPLGYAYVAFSSAEEVDRIMESRPYSINGSQLTVQRRLERKKEKIKN